MYKAVSIALSLKDAKGYLRSWHTTPEEADNWLKSLKERVQPKQEWSEEDEQLYNDLSDTYFYNDEDYPEETYKQMLKRVLDWMNKRAKSIRPQNGWRPSEDQMKMLDKIIDALSQMQLFGGRNALIELKHGLKKLTK